MGIRGIALNLCKSYFTDRTQCVSIGTALSSYRDVIYGVPQGKALEPILFPVCIWDIMAVINIGNIISFEDDTLLLFTDKTRQVIFKQIENMN